MGGMVGFIGLGNMGAPMAGRLADAGYRLVAYDTRDDAVQPLVARGARHVHSPAEVGANSETVLVSLPTPEIVRQVVFGPDSDFTRIVEMIERPAGVVVGKEE